MKRLLSIGVGLLGLISTQVFAWGNHTIPAYRAFEKMPEVGGAAHVPAETLESFLKAEEKGIEELLISQEAWAKKNLDIYPELPAALTFKANPAMSDEARRLAFLMAIRIAPNSKFALAYQPDPAAGPVDASKLVPFNTVSTLPEQPNTVYKFVGYKPGEKVAPLWVIATASDEPDYGLDINLWSDSPSDWGKVYGFGNIPFGKPNLYFATQAPFHMAFYHEAAIMYKAAGFIKRTFPQLRVHQYTTLAELAFRTGHPYWGWRFSGLALHYIQDLTQPYHSSLSPGSSTARLMVINLLAIAGMPGKKEDAILLLTNRHLALEKYQNQTLFGSAVAKQETSADKTLRKMDKDSTYPAWHRLYARDVVTRQAYDYGNKLDKIIVDSMPNMYVNSTAFDFGEKESGIDLKTEINKQEPAKVANLDNAVAELLENFGSHSRNLVRGVLAGSKSK